MDPFQTKFHDFDPKIIWFLVLDQVLDQATSGPGPGDGSGRQAGRLDWVGRGGGVRQLVDSM